MNSKSKPLNSNSNITRDSFRRELNKKGDFFFEQCQGLTQVFTEDKKLKLLDIKDYKLVIYSVSIVEVSNTLIEHYSISWSDPHLIIILFLKNHQYMEIHTCGVKKEIAQQIIEKIENGR